MARHLQTEEASRLGRYSGLGLLSLRQRGLKERERPLRGEGLRRRGGGLRCRGAGRRLASVV